MNTPVIIWFRRDLRLSDNPALAAAVAAGAPVIPVYIDDIAQSPPMGGASRWWLHHSLVALDASLYGNLILRRGEPKKIIPEIMKETGASALYLNRCYDGYSVARDTEIKTALTDAGKAYHSFNASLLNEPWEITSNSGGPMRVFTPYWKKARARDFGALLSAPKNIKFHKIKSDDLADWKLLPIKPDWSGGLRHAWQPGEANAQKLTKEFLQDDLQGYADGRNIPGRDHTSRLSPHLHFGEISPRQIFHAVDIATAQNHALASDAENFRYEIGWREFSYHLLFHNPDLATKPLQPKFAQFPWLQNKKHFLAWRRGQTGFPIIDAGMRELWTTGYMHNRVRMIVASFLIKNLLLPWQKGERWFWDTLVDADHANNAASWQWVAGCGADAAPYYRIFNPVLQGEKFDPHGEYVRRWVPELADVPDKFIHQPWLLPQPPEHYPAPIIELKTSRDRALRAYKTLNPGDEI